MRKLKFNRWLTAWRAKLKCIYAKEKIKSRRFNDCKTTKSNWAKSSKTTEKRKQAKKACVRTTWKILRLSTKQWVSSLPSTIRLCPTSLTCLIVKVSRGSTRTKLFICVSNISSKVRKRWCVKKTFSWKLFRSASRSWSTKWTTCRSLWPVRISQKAISSLSKRQPSRQRACQTWDPTRWIMSKVS